MRDVPFSVNVPGASIREEYSPDAAIGTSNQLISSSLKLYETDTGGVPTLTLVKLSDGSYADLQVGTLSASTVNAPTGGGSTYIICSESGSTAQEQAQANVIVPTGTDVNNDWAIAMSNMPYGGKLILHGSFLVDADNAFYTSGSLYGLSLVSNLEIDGGNDTTLKFKDGLSSGGYPASVVMINVANVSNVKIHGIKFDNNDLNETGLLAALWCGSDSTNIEIYNNIFTSTTSPANPATTASWGIYGDYLIGTDTPSTDWSIHDNLFAPAHNSYGVGLHNQPNFSQIYNNRVIPAVDQGIEGIQLDSVYGCDVYGNYITSIHGYCIELFDAVGFNKIHDNRLMLRASGTYGVYVHTKGNSTSTSYGNEIYDNFMQDLDYGVYIADAYCVNTLVQNNTFDQSRYTYADSAIQTTGTSYYFNQVTDYGTNTVIRNNPGYNPIGILAKPFNTATIGLQGDTDTPSADTWYIVSGDDLSITVSGGTGVSITIRDTNVNALFTGDYGTTTTIYVASVANITPGHTYLVGDSTEGYEYATVASINSNTNQVVFTTALSGSYTTANGAHIQGTNIVIGLTTLSDQYLPLGYAINFGSFSVAPTVTVSGH